MTCKHLFHCAAFTAAVASMLLAGNLVAADKESRPNIVFIFADDIGRLRRLQQRAEHEMRDTLGIHARVKLVEPHRIERSTGKSKRVIDRRDVYGHG